LHFFATTQPATTHGLIKRRLNLMIRNCNQNILNDPRDFNLRGIYV
jgi:hypothetical protein